MTTMIYRTPQKVADLGFRALVQKLGPGGAIEFVHQYEVGEGNYTKERKKILSDFKLETLANEKEMGFQARPSKTVGRSWVKESRAKYKVKRKKHSGK